MAFAVTDMITRNKRLTNFNILSHLVCLFVRFQYRLLLKSKSHQGKMKNSVKIIAYTILVGLFISSCNENTVSQDPDLFSVYTVVTGQVFDLQTEEPLEGSRVFANEKGFDCKSNLLAQPIKFDSTTANQNGEFTLKITFLNTEKPVCLDVFAVDSKDTLDRESNKIEFKTALRKQPPYDTTRVQLFIIP